MADNENGRVGIELLLDKDAIWGGHAHLWIHKLWTMGDWSHKGSLAKAGVSLIAAGKLPVEFPVENECMTLDELKGLIKGVMDSFSGSWDSFVSFVDTEKKDY